MWRPGWSDTPPCSPWEDTRITEPGRRCLSACNDMINGAGYCGRKSMAMWPWSLHANFSQVTQNHKSLKRLFWASTSELLVARWNSAGKRSSDGSQRKRHTPVSATWQYIGSQVQCQYNWTGNPCASPTEARPEIIANAISWPFRLRSGSAILYVPVFISYSISPCLRLWLRLGPKARVFPTSFAPLSMSRVSIRDRGFPPHCLKLQLPYSSSESQNLTTSSHKTRFSAKVDSTLFDFGSVKVMIVYAAVVTVFVLIGEFAAVLQAEILHLSHSQYPLDMRLKRCLFR